MDTDTPVNPPRRRPWRAPVALVAAALVVLLAPARARADAVPAPPSSCPTGGTPSTSHCGQTCRAVYCTADADCPQGRSCRELPLCIKTITCHSNWAIDGGVSYADTVTATCANGRDCAADAPCKMVRVCSGSEPVIAGCAVSPRAAPLSVGAWILGLLTLVTALDRARRARARR